MASASRVASGQVVVGVLVLGLARRRLVEAAVIDQQRERLAHVLRPDAQRPVVGIVRTLVERGGRLHADERRVLHAGLRIGLEHRVDRGFGILRRFLERARRRAQEALHEVGLRLERSPCCTMMPGADQVDAVVGEADRVDRLLASRPAA